VGKTYWAVVEGGPDADEGTVDLALGRLDASRGWWMKPDPKGLPSVTTWKVLGRGKAPRFGASGLRANAAAPMGSAAEPMSVAATPVADAAEPMADAEHSGPTITWLALTPVTGRTHQLRVHCAAMGWPVLGDAIYGTAPRFGGPALHLHAREVVVPIARNREPVRVTAPLPAHMRDALEACGWEAEGAA
jgi:tRNA pseudouridine32 synthase / 23S rRNA pseudouridine746 synthase